MQYNPKYLEYEAIFTKDEIKYLNHLNLIFPLEIFLNEASLVNKMGFDFIYSSAQIEGNTYTKADTLALLEYGRTAGGKKYSDAKMILNLRKSYNEFIDNEYDVDLKTLKDFHYILSDDLISDLERGCIRNSSIGGSMGCDYVPLGDLKRLDNEIKYLFTIYNKIKEPFDKALYLHNNLAYLQYFRDVNKRTARIMQNISLKKSNKMILIPREEFITDYIAGVLRYYETGNYDKYKKFFIKNYEFVANWYKNR